MLLGGRIDQPLKPSHGSVAGHPAFTFGTEKRITGAGAFPAVLLRSASSQLHP
jgi:hypothetical protein